MRKQEKRSKVTGCVHQHSLKALHSDKVKGEKESVEVPVNESLSNIHLMCAE